MATIQSRERAPRRDAAENRAAILAAARTVLAGDPDAPLDAIVAAAGLSRRAFYGHFASRDELRREVAQQGAARVTAAVQDVSHPDSRVVLARIGARMWGEIEDFRVLAQRTIRGPLLDAIGDALAPLRELILATVTRGIENGELRQDMAPDTLARLIEGAALAVLDEAAAHQLDHASGVALVTGTTLGVAGLSWRETAEVVATGLADAADDSASSTRSLSKDA
jgi:AcrR family transcriptional regulator